MSLADATPRLSTITKGGSVQNISATWLPKACFGNASPVERKRTSDVPISVTTITNIASEISRTTRKMLRIVAALGDAGSRTGTSTDAIIASIPGGVQMSLRISKLLGYGRRRSIYTHSLGDGHGH